MLQKSRKQKLEKRIEYYRDMVKRLMSDQDILKELGENALDFNLEELEAVRKNKIPSKRSKAKKRVNASTSQSEEGTSIIKELKGEISSYSRRIIQLKNQYT